MLLKEAKDALSLLEEDPSICPELEQKCEILLKIIAELRASVEKLKELNGDDNVLQFLIDEREEVIHVCVNKLAIELSEDDELQSLIEQKRKEFYLYLYALFSSVLSL